MRVPHLIVELGGIEGLEILNNQAEELLDYYQKFFLMDAKKYIEERKMQEIQIELGESNWLMSYTNESQELPLSPRFFSKEVRASVSVTPEKSSFLYKS